MKIAFLVDNTAQESFYVKDGCAYRLDTDEPYYVHNGISNKYFIACYGIPFAVKNGYYINWYSNGLPDIDFDVIFVVLEKDIPECNVSALRKKYPNAILIATTKERNPNVYCPPSRIQLFNECDKVVIPYFNISDELKSRVNKEIHSYAVPYDIDLINNLYYKQNRIEALFIGSNRWAPNRGLHQTMQLASMLQQETNLPVITETTDYKNLKPGMIEKWLELKSNYTLCLNVDGPEQSVGQVAIQCAILGVIHIGGVTESAQFLFPSTSGMDLNKLKNTTLELLHNYDLRIKIMQDAYNEVINKYSFNAFNNNLQNILK